ncbi:hypothetical protein BT69DRAFT_1221753 [Atractiella rhizophila]|nr:hypothetical protein BT69DRAFT_1221753 [Atractiella rhizophila]
MLSLPPFLQNHIPALENWAAKSHLGNYVVHGRGELVFESMPIYARLGMHLLYYGRAETRLLHYTAIEDLLKSQTERMGRIYDSKKDVLKKIRSFVKTYELEESLKELLIEDLNEYPTFNSFFYRKLKVDARPVLNASEQLSICSAADCRLAVYESVSDAKEFWIKGRRFTIPHLLGDKAYKSLKSSSSYNEAALAIFRLAPQDYHRFHSPVDGKIGRRWKIEGTYYTVNPQAVNQDFNVFTENRRDVLLLECDVDGKKRTVAYVAIGAMLVGSVGWTHPKLSEAVKRGEELGYFAYGGSTIVAVFPRDLVHWDADLKKNSKDGLETLVKVGESIGHWCHDPK